MDISSLAAYGVSTASAQAQNVLQVKLSAQSATQAALSLSEQATQQVKTASAQAAASHKIDIIA